MAQAESTYGMPRNRRRLLLILLAAILLLLLCVVIIIIIVPWLFNPVADPAGPYPVNEDQTMVTFDGSGSRVRWGTISAYAWDFGDGNVGSGVSPSHTYPQDGPAEYSVTLTVTDNRGRTDTDTTQVTVVNLPPTAEAGGPYECQVNETIQLAGECDDPSPIDRETLTCTWADFSGAAVSQPSYTCPATPGSVTVTLTATDKDGASTQDSATVTVTGNGGEQVKADANGPYQGVVGAEIQFDGSGSTPAESITDYTWDFGDGQTGNGITPTHIYSVAGTYSVMLTVSNGVLSNTDTTTATITHDGLVADPNGPYTATVGETIQFDGSNSRPADSIVSYSWNFGDGSAFGTGITPTHSYTTASTYIVTLTVEDKNGNRAQAETTATIEPLPPNPPRAVIRSCVRCGCCFHFDGYHSTGSDGSQIIDYDWDMGDGNTKKGVAVRHKYAMPGVYIVTLTITDSTGAQDSSSIVIKLP